MAKAFAEMQSPNPGLQSLDAFMQSSGIGAMGPGGGGGGAGTGEGGPGGGGAGGAGGYAEVLGASGTGVGYGSGYSPGGGGPGGPGQGGMGPGMGPGSGPGGGHPAPGSGPTDIENMVQGFFTSSLMDSNQGPQQRSYVELAKIIKEMRPEFVLQNFPPQRREELRSLPPDQMAAEIIEDTAVKWAMDRLITAPSGQEAVIVEEEVIRVLLRSLQTTQMADRLAKKLAEFVKQYSIPPTTVKRINDELAWVTLKSQEKTAQLLTLENIDAGAFRRLVEHVKDLIKQADFDSATALGNQYLAFLDQPGSPSPEEMGRVPELLRTMAGVRTDFWKKTCERLVHALEKRAENEFLHRQIINALVALSKTSALYEDFGIIQVVGTAFEKSAALGGHDACCAAALRELLTTHAVDRVVEIFIQNKDDLPWTRQAALLLRWSGTPAISKVFQHLEDEPTASLRLAMLRLIARIGPAALVLARQQLKSDRWYVVRNGCKLLGELKDPDMLEQLGQVLKHPDPRVQKAAVVALMDTRDKGRAPVLAGALREMDPQVLDDVFADLLFLKDPRCQDALENFIFEHEHGKVKMLTQAVQALAAIPGQRTLDSLMRVLADGKLDKPVRRAALHALVRQAEGAEMVIKFVEAFPDDPLAADALKQAKAAGHA
jgi:hypothetical protein